MGATADIHPWGNGQVLKLFRPGHLPGEVEAEAEVTWRAHAAGVPCPAVSGVVVVDGRQGIVLERIEGPSMLEEAVRPPWPVARMARLLADLHAQLHRQEASELPSLKERLSVRVEAAPGLPETLREAVLRGLAPLSDGNAVCHGDFHPGNVLLSPRGPVLIDWIDAARGDPAADVTRSLLLLEVASPPGSLLMRGLVGLLRSRFRRVYRRRYDELVPGVLERVPAWRAAVAAVRLNARFPAERGRLLEMVRTSIPPPPG